ncbi:Ras-like GTP-binding protein RYL2 [Penicillium argentinense]|uniref:Ras-like GTP-binding protein RYL2 n=1 Tax=Penicillium argentinense TaxID=1131581 RepID=A0A9W9KLA2_9EURO|nr:Ras-like GTP-binding protein RYL2 [Penicillium argentinense]KAJ5110475.1 Ras-like GTP-binding protein RYL2 [Penicillium argentinense]
MRGAIDAKLVILGAQGVGKTSLVRRYLKNTFNPSTTHPTVGADFDTKQLRDASSDTTIRLQIWDTAGQERFRSISRLYYRGADACLLVYDITNEASFEELTGWLRELREELGDPSQNPVVIQVVGTKTDIVAEDPSRREVPFERTIAYVSDFLYPSPPQTADAPRASALSFASGFFSSTSVAVANGASVSGSRSTLLTPSCAIQSPDSKRSSTFWGQDIGWDSCHEISAKDGEGIEEVFQVIARKLVEQHHRRAENAMHMDNPDPQTVRPGSAGAKRRSWLGLASPSVVTVTEEEEVGAGARGRQSRCC